MTRERERLWLLYPQKLVQQPIIYRLGHEFELITNIRQATVQDEIGIVSLELEGEQEEIERGIEWLESLGVKVQPVEINVIES